MKLVIPAIALLALALAACNAEHGSAANDAVSSQAAADPAAPPPLDQPTEDVPPATAPTPASGQQAADAGLARMDGYGDLRFGMGVDEAKQAWGGELQGAPPDEAGGCHYLSPKWVKQPSDFAFMFEGGKFVRYDVGTAKEAAPGGGKVGMTAAEIERLYPGRVEVLPHHYLYDEGGKYLRIASDAGGKGVLLFETDGKAVTEWRVGMPPQVDYVEGCS